GRVTLTGSPDDFPVFDAVFAAWFGDATFAGKVANPDEEEAPPNNRPKSDQSMLQMVDGDATGHLASEEHLRNRRSFARETESDRAALARLRRRLGDLPTLASRNRVPAHAGPRIDLVRTTRAARRTFGETLRILRQTRPDKPRRLLLLVDVSGSMKAHSETTLRFAQLVTRGRPKVETFCFGTRLTRITTALKHRDPGTALAGLADLVFDFDGGTMIGAALEEFLSVSRHAALVRGAVTLVFSDGLERGDPAAMVHAVERLARLSHRLVWATPLAADPRYRPATRAISAILPFLDALVDGSSLPALERLVGRLDHVERGGRGMAGRTRDANRADG
ncbi:MAG: VWA domain-containing protein, partial [Mesorhizobium sp.]|nr:VWA domain-containing protein [Mesorhizobium sp.]